MAPRSNRVLEPSVKGANLHLLIILAKHGGALFTVTMCRGSLWQREQSGLGWREDENAHTETERYQIKKNCISSQSRRTDSSKDICLAEDPSWPSKTVAARALTLTKQSIFSVSTSPGICAFGSFNKESIVSYKRSHEPPSLVRIKKKKKNSSKYL